ncbi:MAG TPA: flippase-like domain-containing protein [Dehalococcoidia bacterium]|nr:flippase-like domain-containing protein [Dehalococcoidia bacterium]
MLAIIAVALLTVLLALMDWEKAWQLGEKADWKLALIAFLFIALSYFCLSGAFVSICRTISITIPRPDVFKIGILSVTLDNILAFGGLAGHSLRVLLMQRDQTPAGKVMAASLLHSYFNAITLATIFPIGLVYVLVTYDLPVYNVVILIVFTSGFFIGLAIAALLLFKSALRKWILDKIDRLWRFFFKRNITSFLAAFDMAMSDGLAAMRGRPIVLAIPLGLIVLQWVVTVVGLWFCFNALGISLSLGSLLTGFSVGISAGNVAMIPAGLGIQEASMSGVYAIFGTRFEQAVLASLLFRVLYDIIPFVVSLPFYRKLLQKLD